MALKKCHECGHKVSTTAEACPSCGAKVKKSMGCGSMLLLGFFGLVVFSMMMSAIGSSSNTSSPQATPAPPPIDRARSIEAARQKFETVIADKYKELLALKESGDTQGALRIVRQFENFKRTDYENVAILGKELQMNDALARLSKVSSTDIKALSEIYVELSGLDPTNEEYKGKAERYSALFKEQEAARIAQERKEAQEKALAEDRNKKIQSQFSAWDGSHRSLEKLIKASMNDPDSYDHVETVYSDMGDSIVVKTTFRGKNGFGGVVKNWIRAKFTIDGTLISVVDQGP